AGVGDGFTAGLLRHSQRKRGATDRPGLRSTAPALDPTLGEGTAVTWFPYPTGACHVMCLWRSTMAETAQPLPHIPGYEIRRKLGQGGMGVVYEAVQLADSQRVALKMIVGAMPEHVVRFRREVQAVARLKHPNIVQLHNEGEH